MTTPVQVYPPAENQDYGDNVYPPPQDDAGSGGVNTEDEGVAVNTPATTINFVGSGVEATDAGSGQTDVTVDAGPGITPPLQKFFGRRRPRWISSHSTTTLGMVNFGPTSLTSLGSPSNTPQVPASTGYVDQWSTSQINALSTANAWAGFATSSMFHLGSGTNVGGLYYSAEFAITRQNGTFRFFDGFLSFSPVAAITSGTDPSSLTSFIGFGLDSGDTNLQLMHNDSSGTATKIDLGSDFVMQGTSGIAYFCSLFWTPNPSSIDYWCQSTTNAGTVSTPVTGTISTNMPANSQMLWWTRQICSTAATKTISYGSANTYFETPGW